MAAESGATVTPTLPPSSIMGGEQGDRGKDDPSQSSGQHPNNNGALVSAQQLPQRYYIAQAVKGTGAGNLAAISESIPMPTPSTQGGGEVTCVEDNKQQAAAAATGSGDAVIQQHQQHVTVQAQAATINSLLNNPLGPFMFQMAPVGGGGGGAGLTPIAPTNNGGLAEAVAAAAAAVAAAANPNDAANSNNPNAASIQSSSSSSSSGPPSSAQATAASNHEQPTPPTTNATPTDINETTNVITHPVAAIAAASAAAAAAAVAAASGTTSGTQATATTTANAAGGGGGGGEAVVVNPVLAPQDIFALIQQATTATTSPTKGGGDPSATTNTAAPPLLPLNSDGKITSYPVPQAGQTFALDLNSTQSQLSILQHAQALVRAHQGGLTLPFLPSLPNIPSQHQAITAHQNDPAAGGGGDSTRKEKKSKKRKSTSTRTRISIACMNCRGSKVKCTGGKPCARCKKMKIECVIPEQRSKRRAGGGTPSRRHFLEPIIDEHGKRRKALADKFNRNNGQKCYRNDWCTRPNKHPGHCKDHRASANNHR